MSPRGKAHNPAMRPEWQQYWDNPLAPHPDAGKPLSRGRRKTAPFSKARQAHYCHHYRQDNEHYHSSMKELEECAE